MSDEIKVTVVEFGDRACYQLQYRDPMTRRKKTKSSGVLRDGSKKSRDAAQRAAGNWEEQLKDGPQKVSSRISWADFRDRYAAEKLASLAPRTESKVQEIFDAIEKHLNPGILRDLTPARLSYFQSKLREGGRAETTIAGTLGHLRSALQWAVDMEMLTKVPKIAMPQRGKGSKLMKGRPITLEEFERMLAKTEGIVGSPAAESWRFYLRGLWTSGLRLSESLELWWDRDDKLCVDLTGRRPMLWIPAALEKGNKDRRLPMAPEFAELLLSVPQDQRTGPVFNPKSKQRTPRLSAWSVGTTVSTIGERAGVKVNTDAKGIVKYASAHDLRRSFGERWATKVVPQVLMELMRHESIETTMRFYVGENADRTADVLWQVHAAGNTSGNTARESAEIAGD